MTIDITEEQATGIRLLGWWWGCIVAGRTLDGEGDIADDAPILSTVEHGATAIVTAGHLRAVASINTYEREPMRAVSVRVLEAIENWSHAYPLEVFPEPDMKEAREALEARGLTLDCVSASNMRHVIRGVQTMLETNEP